MFYRPNGFYSSANLLQTSSECMSISLGSNASIFISFIAPWFTTVNTFPHSRDRKCRFLIKQLEINCPQLVAVIEMVFNISTYKQYD